MNEVTLRAAVMPRVFDGAIEFTVTGEGRTLEAIKRMVPAHVDELREIGWNAKSDELPNGVKFTVTANEGQPLTKLKALGFFMGIMVQGGAPPAASLDDSNGSIPNALKPRWYARRFWWKPGKSAVAGLCGTLVGVIKFRKMEIKPL